MPTDTVPDTPLTGVSLPTEELACSVPTLAEPETSPCPPTVTEPVTLRVPTEVVEAGSVLVIVSLATDPVVDKDRVADPEIPTVEIESRLADAPKVPKEAAPETGFTGVSLPTTPVAEMDSVALPDRGLTGVCLPTAAEVESARTEETRRGQARTKRQSQGTKTSEMAGESKSGLPEEEMRKNR